MTRGLGLTAADLARQVRGAFYGAEALRVQRGRDEVKVMVRLPAAERRSPFTIEQLIIIMVSIPFGMIGAVIGHILMGYELSVISMFGIVALAGVVVNDSLILVHTANRNRWAGESHFDSIFDAACRRFRPIVLTSLTTFLGLAPMIFETSIQARFLIPMAISLGFGILFATLIALVIVPCLYLALVDVKRLLGAGSEGVALDPASATS